MKIYIPIPTIARTILTVDWITLAPVMAYTLMIYGITIPSIITIPIILTIRMNAGKTIQKMTKVCI